MEYRYFLTYTERIEVEEPAEMGNVTSMLSRDFETHGVTYEFTESDLTVKFYCEGRKVLLDAYYTKGADAEVIFEVESREYNLDAWALHSSSPLKADLSSLHIDADYASCSFYKDDLVSKLRTNNDVTVNLDAEESLNSSTLQPLEQQSALFHSKTIQKAAMYKYNEAFATKTYGWLQNEGNIYLIPAFQKTVVEVDGADEASNPSEISGPLELPQYGNIFYSGKLGSRTRNISVTGQLVFSLRNTRDTNTYVVHLNVYRYSINSQTLEDVGGTGGGTYNSTTKRFELPFYANVNMKTDENLIVALTFLPPGPADYAKTIDINVDMEQSSMQLTENTVTEGIGSTMKCYRLYDAIRRNLEVITDTQEVLKSDFLKTGPASANVVLNGYMLRQFAGRAPEFTFKDAMQAMQAIFNVGYGVEGVGKDQKIVIEDMLYFYRNNEIIRLDAVSDYQERVAEEYLLNQLQIGFQKYAQNENQTNTIDDVHTKHEYLLPIKAVKQKKDIICPWILSAYLIEVTRRKAYEETPTESFKYDNDIFMIYTNGSDMLAAEKDEAFMYVHNILSPETMYNLRYTPKRMLLNHGQYLNSFMYYHDRKALIRNQQALLNGKAETQFRATEPFKIGDEQGFKRTEGGHEKLEDIYSMKRIFRPEIVSFTTTMCKEDLDLIIKAHQGTLTGTDEGRNYGYVNVQNFDGEYVAIYILNMRWNYLERVVEIEGIKRATEPEPVQNLPGLLQETLGYDFITTEGGIVIALE